MDGLLVDCLVQDRIDDARQHVGDARREVHTLLVRLRAESTEARLRIADLEDEPAPSSSPPDYISRQHLAGPPKRAEGRCDVYTLSHAVCGRGCEPKRAGEGQKKWPPA